MKTVTQHIRDHLEKQIRPDPRPRPSLDSLKQSQWSPEFERLMRNRLILGAMRYETLDEKRRNNKYAIIDSVLFRLEMYKETGNQEYLVDSANLLLIEFECPTHPHPHFHAHDDGVHVTERFKCQSQ